MKKIILITVFSFVAFFATAQEATQVAQEQPQVKEINGDLVYVVPAVAAQKIVLTLDILEKQDKAIIDRQKLLEEQMKAIQEEYAVLEKQKSDNKDWTIRLLKLEKSKNDTKQPTGND